MFRYAAGTHDHEGYHPEQPNADRLYNTRYLDFAQRLLGNVTDRAARHNVPQVCDAICKRHGTACALPVACSSLVDAVSLRASSTPYNSKQVWLTETNSICHQGLRNGTDAYINSVWLVNRLGLLASRNLTFAGRQVGSAKTESGFKVVHQGNTIDACFALLTGSFSSLPLPLFADPRRRSLAITTRCWATGPKSLRFNLGRITVRHFSLPCCAYRTLPHAAHPLASPFPDTTLLFRNLVGPQVLPASVKLPAAAKDDWSDLQGARARAYAYCRPGSLGDVTLTLLNFDNATAATFAIDELELGDAALSDIARDGTSRLDFLLTPVASPLAEYPWISRHMALNGVALNVTADGDLPPLEGRPAKLTDALILPPLTIAFVVLSGINAPACR